MELRLSDRGSGARAASSAWLTLMALTLAASASAQTSLPTFIDTFTAKPPFDHAIWGIVVEEDDGTLLYARNAHTLLMPASNRKLFAASTVVDCLGASKQFTTELWIDGEDVIIKGGGDPSFAGRYYDTPPQALSPFIEALRRRGVSHVRDVIADVSLFDRITIPHSWKVGNLPSYYSPPVDAVTFAENATSPESSVPEPGLYAAAALRDALVLAGIPVRGRMRLNVEPRVWREQLASLSSPFVEQILGTVIQNSNNLYTEVLFKDVSAGGAPASYAASFDLERDFLVHEVGIDENEFRFVDGSGLSPDDLVTPAAIVKVLRWMNEPWRRGIFLPIMASPVTEGTLHHRLSDLGSRLHGKTGTINGVNALSGFVTGANGRTRYFSIVLNHHTADSSEATRIIDDIVREIAKF
jgi:D-alanyl-D-alanine carboxypeptidase/D-alanyl-D-alanine-endopeptidase (penicillin-binding protein 4)